MLRPYVFSVESLGVKALVDTSYFFQNRRFTEIIRY